MRLQSLLCLLICAAARAQEPTPEAIEQALARYRGEPSAAEVVAAALETGDSDPARVRDAITRARASGWLPQLRTRLRRGQAINLRALATGDPTNYSTGDDLYFDASLNFRLDRLIFAPEETRLMRELRALEDRRSEIALAVLALYFERRRLQLERDLIGGVDVARTLRILEIQAILDVFTAGRFTRMMEASQRDPP